MAKGERPVKRMTAVLKNDKSKRFDIGACWPSKIGDDVLNFSLDRTCKGIKVEPRGGGKAVVLTNDVAFFQIEDPYDPDRHGGGGHGEPDDGDDF